MSQSDQDPFLYSTQTDIAADIRAYVMTLRQQLLACIVDLRSHVKQAAWNVKGKYFSQLQALFATITAELEAHTNLVAERIAALDGVVQGTVRMAAQKSTLREYPTDIVEGDAHVLALAERFAHYAKVMGACIAHAADVEDADTASVYTDISHGIDKRLWFLEAHLHQ